MCEGGGQRAQGEFGGFGDEVRKMATCGVPWMMGGMRCTWGCGVRREGPAQVSHRLASGHPGGWKGRGEG